MSACRRAGSRKGKYGRKEPLCPYNSLYLNTLASDFVDFQQPLSKGLLIHSFIHPIIHSADTVSSRSYVNKRFFLLRAFILVERER